MKFLLLNCIFFFNCFIVSAQQDHFIYLESESKQPFYVKIDGKIYNSFPPGYLIISPLQEGSYSLIIGFPPSTAELQFNCTINSKDVGFIIKTTGEKEWELYNLQTQNILKPGDVIEHISKTDSAQEKINNPFALLLANVVHDSTILNKDVAKETVAENTEVQNTNDSAKKVLPVKKVTALNPQKSKVKKGKVPVHPVALHKQLAKENTAAVQIQDSTVVKHDLSLSKSDIATTTDVPHDSSASVKDVAVSIPTEKVPDQVKTDTIQSTTNNSDVAVSRKEKRKKKKAESDTTAMISNVVIAPEKEKEKIKTDSATSGTDANNVAVSRKEKRKIKKAAADTAALQKDVAVNDNKQPVFISDSSATPAPKEKRKRKKAEADLIVAANQTVDNTLFVSSIKRRSRKTTREGLEMVYVDQSGDETDTIRIVIPAEKPQKKKEVAEPEVTDAGEVKTDQTISDKKQDQVKKDAAKEKTSSVVMINSDCKAVATDDDFLKLRKKMVAEATDDDMIRVAKKTFKTRCFTTEQVKNLGVLFLTDQGRYAFFDAAYPFVSDSDVFNSLESQLSDSYYINRFRAMIRK